jgi:signal transduction histidine kinase
MASRASEEQRSPWRRLVAPDIIAAVWLPVVAVGAFHYGTSHEHHWVHDILRRAYYLPIVFGAMRAGLFGGLITAAVVTVTYLPHAFLHPVHFDPADSMEKVLEILLYFVVAGIAGYLTDQERHRTLELREALEEQQRLQLRLVRAGRLSALGEVVAGIAHEIKNPLHSLAGTAEVVDPLVPVDAEERRMWEIHREEIARLGRVAERFLTFANPETPKMEDIDLRDVAERLIDLTGADARQKGIEIGADLPDGPVRVRGDLDQLAQVGLNIALNGIRAIGSGGGRIRVAVGHGESQGETMAFLRIENDGPAIAEDEIEHLFDPFHTGGEGTGLGLAISSRITEQHGGFIEAQNAGLGVTFSVYLPAVS